MKQDEIIEMARQAGSIDSDDVILTVYNAFASAEREACADLCYQLVDNSRETRFASAIRARGEA